ncbi:hypothetical protein PAHAL_1G352500 [Panicum hallii]|jgi:hypothetical protein|uniref:Uncharacterized protein n=1 Tax=Panicum hallii TaxID=206008 RepID=A0A2T8KXA6_9POAL|nr:hypothetical protein PAHAL_1G352500 [Panicum hallii]
MHPERNACDAINGSAGAAWQWHPLAPIRARQAGTTFDPNPLPLHRARLPFLCPHLMRVGVGDGRTTTLPLPRPRLASCEPPSLPRAPPNHRPPLHQTPVTSSPPRHRHPPPRARPSPPATRTNEAARPPRSRVSRASSPPRFNHARTQRGAGFDRPFVHGWSRASRPGAPIE